MQIVILAGGAKSTVTDNVEGIPKPMAEIGEKPILWHIMKFFSGYGYKDFIICGGYKVNQIKEYFMDYYIYQSDITVDLRQNTVEIHKKKTEDWTVTVVDTGIDSTTEQRIAKVKDYIEGDDFIVAYGDCLSDISITELVQRHKECGAAATISVARPTGRNKTLAIGDGGILKNSDTSDERGGAWVNACLMVFSKSVFQYNMNEQHELEDNLILKLTEEKQVATYQHTGFWMPMETNRDRTALERMWRENRAPWKNW